MALSQEYLNEIKRNAWKKFLRSPLGIFTIAVIVIGILIFIGGIAYLYTPYNPSAAEIVTCKSCDREYKKGSDNAKSIARSGMCTNCYNNYKSMQNFLDEQPLN